MKSAKKTRLTKAGRHKAKLLTYNGRKVRIDEEIAPLLSNMWKLGIRTSNSCQENCSFKCNHKYKIHPEKDGTTYQETLWTKSCLNCVWLVFEHALDAELFYNIVAEYVPADKDDGTMYADIQGYNWKKRPGDVWTLNCYARNYGVEGHFGRPKWGNKRSTCEMWMEDGCKKNMFIIQPQLTFPRKHLAYVEGKIKEALKAKRKKK